MFVSVIFVDNSNFLIQGTGTGHPQFMEEVAWDACGLGYPPMHEDKSKNDGKKVGSSSLLTPSADELRDSKEEQVAQVCSMCTS